MDDNQQYGRIWIDDKGFHMEMVKDSPEETARRREALAEMRRISEELGEYE